MSEANLFLTILGIGFFVTIIITVARISFPFYWIVYSDIRRFVEGKITLRILLGLPAHNKEGE